MTVKGEMLKAQSIASVCGLLVSLFICLLVIRDYCVDTQLFFYLIVSGCLTIIIGANFMNVYMTTPPKNSRVAIDGEPYRKRDVFVWFIVVLLWVFTIMTYFIGVLHYGFIYFGELLF